MLPALVERLRPGLNALDDTLAFLANRLRLVRREQARPNSRFQLVLVLPAPATVGQDPDIEHVILRIEPEGECGATGLRG